MAHLGADAARIVVAAGGTGGHVQPALAVARVLRDVAGASVTFVGASGAFETLLVPAEGFEIDVVSAKPLFRRGSVWPLSAALSVVRGVPEARDLLRRRRPDLVLGFGGYATVAAVVAAKQLGIATAIHEANAEPGVANLVLAPWVDRVHSAQEAVRWPVAPRLERVCGHPIRPEVQALVGLPRSLTRGRPWRVLVIGGSQGSPFLNRYTPELVNRLNRALGGLEVLHQTGASADLDAVDALYTGAALRARVVPYLDDIAAAYRWADYVITAAGAGALAEISAAGLPALLVPFAGAARNHQLGNARRFAARTGSLIAQEDGADLSLLAEAIAHILTDARLYEAAARRVRGAFIQDAAQRVAISCLELVGIEPRRLGAVALPFANVVALPLCRPDNGPGPDEPPRAVRRLS